MVVGFELAGLLVVHPTTGTILAGAYFVEPIEGVWWYLEQIRSAGPAGGAGAAWFGFSEHLFLPIIEAGKGIFVLDFIML